MTEQPIVGVGLGAEQVVDIILHLPMSRYFLEEKESREGRNRQGHA